MSVGFEVKDADKRKKVTFANQSKFGTKYIVLPNPTYGKWVQNRGFYNPNLNQDSVASVKSRLNLTSF